MYIWLLECDVNSTDRDCMCNTNYTVQTWMIISIQLYSAVGVLKARKDANVLSNSIFICSLEVLFSWCALYARVYVEVSKASCKVYVLNKGFTL